MNTFLLVASTIVALFMATLMIIIRAKAAKRPLTVKRIILPPLMMSTGAFMFLFPVFHVAWPQVIESLVLGMIFSIFLIKTSKFETQGDHIYLIPSKAFIFLLVGLLIVRLIIKVIIGSTISFGETSGIFFLLGFGMIFTWRMAILYQFKRMKKRLH